MAASYKKFLAGKVFSDEEFVTYRALSWALKVHSNHAKRMLYEFHRSENEKTPGSVHATYLLMGVSEYTKHLLPPTTSEQKDGKDELMQDSPSTGNRPSKPQPAVTLGVEVPMVTSILLVREEELADAKKQFQKLLSIFIYSVQSSSPPDLNVLADIGRASLDTPSETSLQDCEQYGMIQNKNVKRRQGVQAAPPAPIKVENTQPQSLAKRPTEKPVDKKLPMQTLEKKVEPSPVPPSEAANSRTSGKASQAKPALKRETSNIFKAFAKSRPKEPKKEEETSESTPNESQNAMLDDESEEEREDLFQDTKSRCRNMEKDKDAESRKEREERLRKMMEDDDMLDAKDEDMPDAFGSSPEPPSPSEKDKSNVAPTSQENKKLIPKSEAEVETEPGVDSSVSAENPSAGQRRRSRRQVMKKKVSKDAEGYLVTTEEPVWESYSEDEPEPPKRKPFAPSQSSAKSTKGGTKAGQGSNKSSQGSIMSFFGKK